MAVDFIKSQNLIMGATGSGKTTFVKKILKRSRFKFGIIVTTTPWEYTSVRNAYVCGFEEIESACKILFGCSSKMNKYVVIDNFVGVYKVGDCVEKLFTQGRHFNIAVFLLAQYAAKVPPVVRENARYIWVFRSCVKSYELLFNNQNKFSKKRDFIEFMQKKSGYSPIFINNADLSLKDNVIVL